MPKPMLRQPQTQVQTNSVLSATKNVQAKQETQQINKIMLDRILRKNRSRQYLDAVSKLDAGGHTHNREAVDKIITAIKNEFPEINIEGILLGIISTCYLGKPYEVHTLNLSGQIIEHYQKGQNLPGALENARSIAMQKSYLFIEVYVDCFRAVSTNGSVSVIPR